MAGKRPARKVTLENSNEDVVVPNTPARFAGESQGGITITLAMQTPKRLRPGPNLAPRASPIAIPSQKIMPGTPKPRADSGTPKTET